MDSILNTVSVFLGYLWSILVLVFRWFLPADGSLTQVILSMFKIGVVLMLMYIYFDNQRK